MAMQTFKFNPHIQLQPKLLITPSMSVNRLSCTLSSPVVVSRRIGFTSRPSPSHGLSLNQHYNPNETFPIKINTTARQIKTPPNNKQILLSGPTAGTDEAVTETKQDEEGLSSEEEKKEHEHELRWRFIRKVYGILVAQLMFAKLLYGVMKMYPQITAFFTQSYLHLSILLLTGGLSFKVMCFLKKMASSTLSFLYFTIWLIALGVSLANLHQATPNGRMMLAASISTSVVFVSLATFTFSASKKGNNLSSLGKFLLSNYTITVAVIAGFIQMF